jgi:hypothetical protein
VLILKVDEVVCFDILLQVLILKVFMGPRNWTNSDVDLPVFGGQSGRRK